MRDRPVPAERTEAQARQDPMEPTDRADPTLPMERTDPTEPTDSTDPRLAMLSTEPWDHNDHRLEERVRIRASCPDKAVAGSYCCP